MPSHGAHGPKGGQEAHRACGQHATYALWRVHPGAKVRQESSGKEGENQARTIAISCALGREAFMRMWSGKVA